MGPVEAAVEAPADETKTAAAASHLRPRAGRRSAGGRGARGAFSGVLERASGAERVHGHGKSRSGPTPTAKQRRTLWRLTTLLVMAVASGFGLFALRLLPFSVRMTVSAVLT